MATVELLFDYASPYSFLASETLTTKLPDCEIGYRPVYLSGFEREIGIEIAPAIDDPEIKNELRSATEAAAARQVFGVPAFMAGGELFWGHDRMHQVARAVRTDRSPR